MLIGFSLLIGLAVVGERDYFGVAHLTLLPLELLGITLLAARFFTSRLVKWLIVAGCAFDFTMGVLLQRTSNTSTITPEHTYFTGLTFSDAQGQFQIGAPGPDSLHAGAWGNWIGKASVDPVRDVVARRRGVSQRRSGLRARQGEPARGHGGPLEGRRQCLARLVPASRRRNHDARRSLRRQRSPHRPVWCWPPSGCSGRWCATPRRALSAPAAAKPKSSRSRYKR